jgi:hypothetical protein
MRLFLLSFVTFVLAFSGAEYARANGPLSTNLSVGSSGVQVALLQQILNRDPDTQVASSGTGSPGMESTYFGPLTKLAVMRFQTKYANEVLSPAGLVSGTGYVGAYTRQKLNGLSSWSQNPVVRAPTQGPAPTVFYSSPQPSPAAQNPNLENLPTAMALLGDLATEQGYSAKDVERIEAEMKRQAATTTDLRAAFFEKMQSNSRQSIRDASSGSGFFATLHQALLSTFFPARALAQSGESHFGTPMVLFPITCTCGSGYAVIMMPTGPDYVVSLHYNNGVQGYDSHNIPMVSQAILGTYTQGGVCMITGTPCYSIPVEGEIGYVTGSSY